jgi:hypothetical protein
LNQHYDIQAGGFGGLKNMGNRASRQARSGPQASAWELPPPGYNARFLNNSRNNGQNSGYVQGSHAFEQNPSARAPPARATPQIPGGYMGHSNTSQTWSDTNNVGGNTQVDPHADDMLAGSDQFFDPSLDPPFADRTAMCGPTSYGVIMIKNVSAGRPFNHFFSGTADLRTPPDRLTTDFVWLYRSDGSQLEVLLCYSPNRSLAHIFLARLRDPPSSSCPFSI